MSLSEDRFKLVAHHESRDNPAYELVVNKGGPKFKPAPRDDDSTASKGAADTSASSSFSLGGFPWSQGNMNFGPGGRGVITGGPNGTTRVSQKPEWWPPAGNVEDDNDLTCRHAHTVCGAAGRRRYRPPCSR